jgi:hypothetical protein
MRGWQALAGPEQDVIFRQEHAPAGMSSRNIGLSLSIGATTVVHFLQRRRRCARRCPRTRGHNPG